MTIYNLYSFFFYRLYLIFIGFILYFICDFIYYLIILPKYKIGNIPLKKTPFIIKLFTTAPRLLAQAVIDRTSDEFKEHGLYIFCGEQGSGKTMSMTYNINRLFFKYPNCKILTNYGLMIQDLPLNSSDDLLKYNNGMSGIIFGIDEIQATFNSRNWKNFPPDLLACICQNRKSHRVIYSTAQSVSQVDKAIRLQTRRYIMNYTFFDFITVSLWYKPFFDFDGNLEKSKLRKIQIFFQEESLRYQYNTFDLIKSLR